MSRITSAEELSSLKWLYSGWQQFADWTATMIHYAQIRTLDYYQGEYDWSAASCDIGLFKYPWLTSNGDLNSEQLSNIGLSDIQASCALSVDANDLSSYRGWYRAFRWQNDYVYNYGYDPYYRDKYGRLHETYELPFLAGYKLSSATYDPLPGIYSYQNFKSALTHQYNQMRSMYSLDSNWTKASPLLDNKLFEMEEMKKWKSKKDTKAEDFVNQVLKQDLELSGMPFAGGYNYQAYKQEGLYPLGDARDLSSPDFAWFAHKLMDWGKWMYNENDLSSKFEMLPMDADISTLFHSDASAIISANSLCSDVKCSWLNPPGIDFEWKQYCKKSPAIQGLYQMEWSKFMMFEHYKRLCDLYYLTTDEGKSINRQAFGQLELINQEDSYRFEDSITYTYEISNIVLSDDQFVYDYKLRTSYENLSSSTDIIETNEVNVNRDHMKSYEFYEGAEIRQWCSLCIDWISSDNNSLGYKENATAIQRAFTDPMFPATRENERQQDLENLSAQLSATLSAYEKEYDDLEQQMLSTYNEEEDVPCLFYGRIQELYAAAANQIGGYVLSVHNPGTLIECEDFRDRVWDEILQDPTLTTREERLERLRQWEDLAAEFEDADEQLWDIYNTWTDMYHRQQQIPEDVQKAKDKFEEDKKAIEEKLYPVDAIVVDASPFLTPIGSPYATGDTAHFTIYLLHTAKAPRHWNEEGTWLSTWAEKDEDLSAGRHNITTEWPTPNLVCQQILSSQISGITYFPYGTGVDNYMGYADPETSAVFDTTVSAVGIGTTEIAKGPEIYSDLSSIKRLITQEVKNTVEDWSGMNAWLGTPIDFSKYVITEDGTDTVEATDPTLILRVEPILSEDGIHYETVNFEGTERCKCRIIGGGVNFFNDQLGGEEGLVIDVEGAAGVIHPDWPITDITDERWHRNWKFKYNNLDERLRCIACAPIALRSIDDMVEEEKQSENNN